MVHGENLPVLSTAGCKGQSLTMRFLRSQLGIFCLTLALTSQTSWGQLTRSVTLAWDPSPALELVGYRLYYGTAKGNYSEVIDLPPITQIVVPELFSSTAYYFGVTALNLDGIESVYSNEVLVNAPPSINGIPTQFVEQEGWLTIPFRVGDVETPAQFLHVTASVDNPQILPLNRITFHGTGADRSVTLAPPVGPAGPVQVTLTVFDANDTPTSTSFTVFVTAANSPPTIDPVEDRIVAEDSRFQSILLSGISAGSLDEFELVSIVAHSSRPDIIPDPQVLYPAGTDKAYLYFRPVANAYGTTYISVVLDDGQPKNNLYTETFAITVVPVNDPPTFGPLYAVRMAEDSVTSIPLTLYDLENKSE